jgi:hypothetical protein
VKSNPLFMDSTKVRHDSVTTQIEVDELFLYPGEEAFIHIVTNEDKKDRIKLVVCKSGVFQSKAWLNHQEGIHFYITIESAEKKILFTSKAKSTVASYMILEKWSPCFIKQNFEFNKKEVRPKPSGFDFDFDFEFSTQL